MKVGLVVMDENPADALQVVRAATGLGSRFTATRRGT
jgi:hypothetical protein